MKRNIFFSITICMWYLLIANTTFAYTRQDTLRGSNGRGRSWWDVQHYDLEVAFNTGDSLPLFKGTNHVILTVLDNPADSMQIDLQDDMVLDAVYWEKTKLEFSREGNVWWIKYPFHEWIMGREYQLDLSYHGSPRKAKLPPWDGGIVWTKDSTGKPWISVACQGLGASSWWPCKDYQGDEPNSGMDISLKVTSRDSLFTVISNGRLVENKPGITDTWTWKVNDPINTYGISFYAGEYIGWTDTLMGEKGKLDLSFYALRYNEEKARKQFAVAKQMIHCFEYWMGPYPFYEDGYKLVEAPYLGMEHQSAVAYGNEFKMGYRGIDRSASGVGNLFDFIIVHESGHEWFGNNITARDIADNWIHEGITTYTETLFSECAFGKEKAFQYSRGEWFNIRNDRPVIGDYGVNDDGSSDKYDKGSAVMHMIRMIMHDDEKFRQLLRGLNQTFYHQVVTTADVENFIIQFTGLPLKPFFDQYLRTKDIPLVDWYIKKKKLFYRFKNTVPGFTLPLELEDGNKKAAIQPTAEWQSIQWKKGGYNISFSRDFLVQS